jgi:hypothetical protein
MFIQPKYMCDYCEQIVVAEWTGQPHWDIPDGWTETRDDKHYCEDCSRSCGCGQCGGLASYICIGEKLHVRKD